MPYQGVGIPTGVGVTQRVRQESGRVRHPVKVSHHDNEHLLVLSSEEAALLIDLAHAGVFSDLLPRQRRRRRRFDRLLADLKDSLLDTARQVWSAETSAGTSTGRGGDPSPLNYG